MSRRALVSGVPGSVGAEESLRRLARALIASALEAYELERLADPSLPPSVSAKARSAPAAMYSRHRKRWGRAA